MIAQQKTHTLIRSHDFEESEFGIDSSDVSHVIHLLRNQIYSNKTLAVIREYTTNAVDAHVESGKPNLPIQVTLPTKFEPTFKVRDFGSGLNHEEIKNLYTRYCKSTKRQSNSFTGQLGIGCKAGFAYGDSFGIVSYCNGIKNTYNAQVDESTKGKVILLDSSSTTEPNGMEIIISVADSDVSVFRTQSLELFKFFKVRPDIKNLGEDKIKEEVVLLEGSNWKLYEEQSHSYNYYHSRNSFYSPYNHNAIAVMGNIGYLIDPSNINDASKEVQQLCSLRNLRIEFEIGELSVAPSREALEYTKATQKAIIQKLELISKELQKFASEKLSNSSDLYEAKCNWGKVNQALPYGISHVCKDKFSWDGIKIDSLNFEKPKDLTWDCPEVKLRVYEKIEDSKISDGFRVSNQQSYYAIAAEKNLIAINDCESSHGLALRVRTIFKQKPDLKNIFVFTFKDDAWKEKTFKLNRLDKVSDEHLVYLSNFEKSKTNSPSKGTGKGKCSRQNVQLFELRNTHINTQDDWISVDDNNLPSEGIYVPIYRFKIVNNDLSDSYSSGNLIHLMNEIKKHNGMEAKIYGVRAKDVDKLDSSKWMHFDTWLNKNIKKIITVSDCNQYAKENAQIQIEMKNEFLGRRRFTELASSDILEDNNIIKRIVNFMPPRNKDGRFARSTKLDNLIHALELISDEKYNDSYVKNRATITLELTPEEAEKGLEEYPIIKYLRFSYWNQPESHYVDYIQYINQIDQLKKFNQSLV
jgi:hypothetical protein